MRPRTACQGGERRCRDERDDQHGQHRTLGTVRRPPQWVPVQAPRTNLPSQETPGSRRLLIIVHSPHPDASGRLPSRSGLAAPAARAFLPGVTGTIGPAWANSPVGSCPSPGSQQAGDRNAAAEGSESVALICPQRTPTCSFIATELHRPVSQDRVSAATSPGKKARPPVPGTGQGPCPSGDLWHFRGEERHRRLGA
jgi:hypothetical protein